MPPVHPSSPFVENWEFSPFFKHSSVSARHALNLHPYSSGVSNCLAGQADFAAPRHSVLSLIMALSMVSIFRMQATMATFGFLPFAMRRL